jgi:serine/threonine-protein kinase
VTHSLAPGAALQGGRYVIDRPLGAGGMGSVFLAHDTHVDNKSVVIKEMATSFTTEAERREAEAEFKAEMATLATLSHPNIPQISDFFIEGNRHFAVQEYVPGQDLAKPAGDPPRHQARQPHRRCQ